MRGNTPPKRHNSERKLLREERTPERLSSLGIITALRSSQKTTLRPGSFALGQKERTTQHSQLSWGEWRATGYRATPQGRAVANQNNGNLAQKEMQISRSEWESVVTDWFPLLF
ncbi:MAG TPA: hypothetical protein PL017_04700 [Tenuifilaceae bacterium]|nr:hypothetical protein [Tenuifilaceae bacterium]